MFSNFKKYSIGIMVALVLLVNGALFVPQPAHAGVPVLVDASIPDATKSILDTILDALGAASKNAVIRMAGYAIRKVSYDSAVWLATGGKGQSPLSQTKDFGEYLGTVGDQAAGAALQELGRAGGLNLCKIPDINVDAALKIGLRSNFLGPKPYGPEGQPQCTLSQWKDQWFNSSTWSSKYGSDQIGKRLNLTLTTDDSPLGIYGAASEKINTIVRTQKASASLQRQEGGGYAPKVDLAGNIIVPAALVKETAVQNTPDKAAAQNQAQLNATLASGDVKVIPAALTLFLDTLVGTAVKNFQDKGVLPFGLGCATTECLAGGSSQDPALASEYYGLSGGGSVAVAQNFFDYLKTVKIDTVNNYDIISQLNSCTDARGLYNCRADDNLVQALKQAQTAQPITIAEALKTGLLHPDWLLISAKDNSGRNSDPDCYKRSYCQSNIQVLRQLRILPLGFEIAARKSDPDHPWKLGDVVAGFNKCPTDPSIVDDNSPFCHLVDPNWVLKAPPAKCNALAYGSTLLAEGVPDRMQECVDVQTCVNFDGNGNCLDFGYCTREKNTWNFGQADTCGSQFATCRAFQDATGRNVAYLYRTLDSASCSQESVGCNAYSLTQNAAGSWVAPGLNTDGTNKGIYFNNKVQTSCSANSAGCSAFSIASTNGQALYLKKAPDYLNCYDADTSASAPGINWPQTQSDLAKLNPSASCSQYAGVCVPDEVNCNFYTPTKGGDKIPGRFTPAQIVSNQVQWNDQCDAKCNGYAAYREMPGNYANGQSVAYIVPSSGKTCTAQEEGCTAFTNLSTTEGGLEKSEYFTYLRACVSPAKDKGKHFVTYEGTSQGGYQLKTYTLVENKDISFDVVAGAPKYFVKTKTELDKLNAQCNETAYKAGTASPDCRQFNDDNGTIYYRLLAYTIPVSDQCTPYRLSNNEFIIDNTTPALECSNRGGYYNGNTCQFCFQNGEYRDGSCFYDGLPGAASDTAGTSRTCAASANTCRAYKGNNGDNIDQISNDTFDKDAAAVLSLWANGSIVAESTHAGESSLLYGGGQSGLVRSIRMPVGESFDLSFWAKGAGGTITIKVGEKDLIAKQVGVVSVSDAWNFYHVGPFEYSGSTSSAKIVFGENAGRFYLDNVKLVRVKSMLYLVKSSLSVDAVCDSVQSDNLPGDALGCKAYTDQTNKPYYLTGFSYLCRDSAVGCTAVLDTKNTAGPNAQIRNVWLTGPENTTAKAVVGNENYSCIIAVGGKGCYISITGHEPTENLTLNNVTKPIKDYFVQSTVYTGADTPSNAPIYLVANQKATCNQIDLGCTLAGTQRNTPTGLKFVTTTIKNDPAFYDTALCTNEAVGCQSYTDGSDTRYFKDPAVTGQRVCAYRTGVNVNGTQASGWFWKGVGVCSNSPSTDCTANADCGAGDTCTSIGDKACYPDYLNSGTYGVWSSANEKYKNFVAECPTNQNACTEFVDHNDNKQAYYLIKNSKLTAGDCSGQASQRAGCAIFDQTDNPNKFFNTAKLYSDSDSRQGALVAAPQSNDAGNDANTILKVTRDRGCGEWLSCGNGGSDSLLEFDQNAGKYKKVCYNISRCDGGGCGPQVKSDHTNTTLSEGIYRSRGLGWKDMEFSGYSLLDIFPVEELDQLNYSTSSNNWHLIKTVACGTNNCLGESTDSGCKNNGESCGSKGTCENNVCIVTINGSKDVDDARQAPTQACRAFPEKDAPFPNTTNLQAQLNSSQAVVQAYSAAHFCNENSYPSDGSVAHACDCSYQKIQYGDSVTRYWNYFSPNKVGDGIVPAVGGSNSKGIPEGICFGAKNGQKCSNNRDCNSANGVSDGVCQRATKSAKFLGFSGFCLEEDLSRNLNGDQSKHPCITWWPNDKLQGVPDIYNQYINAGFSPSKLNYGDGPYYCAETKNFQFVDREIKTITGIIDCDGDSAGDEEKVSGIFAGYKGKSMEDLMNLLSSQGSYAAPDNTLGNLGCVSRVNNLGAGSYCSANSGKYIYEKFNYEERNNDLSYNAANSRTKLNYLLCPVNFVVRDVVDVKAVSGHGCFADREDLITIDYECVPKSSDVLGYWIDVGNTDFGKDPSKPNVTTRNDTTYTVQNWCTSLYQVGSSGANKGWTERLWEANKYSLPAVGGLVTDMCNPFSATTIGGNPPDKGGVVVNSTKDCYPGVPLAASIKDAKGNELYNDFQHYARKAYTSGQGTIQNIFAMSYAKWNLVQNKDVKNRICIGDDYNSVVTKANLAGNLTTCTDTASCRNKTFGTDTCVARSFGKKCVDNNGIESDGSNDDGTCTTTADCSQVSFDSNNESYPHPRECREYFAPEKRCAQSDVTCISDSDCNKDLGATCQPYLPLTQMKYATNTTIIAWDVSGGKDANGVDVSDPKPPTVLGVDSCRVINGVDVCTEGKPGFSIYVKNSNSYYTNEIVKLMSGQRIDARFFFYADNNQMQVRKVSMDWGDGVQLIDTDYAYYVNQRGARDGRCDLTAGANKGVCTIDKLFSLQNGEESFGAQTYGSCKTDAECKNIPICVNGDIKAQHYGIQKDVTCHNNYFSVNDHVYACEKRANDDLPNDPNHYKKICPVDGFGDGCCVFKPKIQVKDNWGWSTGNCSPLATHPNGGCYDGEPLTFDETDPVSPRPWLIYGDTQTSPISIYVAPKS